MANNTIIFDLDHTLLNSQELKKRLAIIMDIDTDLYNESYKERFGNRNEPYSLDKHIKFLQSKGRVKNGEIEFFRIKKKLDKDLPDLSSFLFKKYSEVIKQSGGENDEKILLTFGNQVWQKKKIEKLSVLKPLFDRIIIEEKEKENSELLKELANKEEKVVIVNDNLIETVKMLEVIGEEKCEVKIIKSIHSEKETDREFAEERGFEYYKSIEDLFNGEDDEKK